MRGNQTEMRYAWLKMMKNSHMEAKLTQSFENFSKLKGKTQIFEKKFNNSSKKLKVSANPLGLLAENRWKKNPELSTKKSVFVKKCFPV